MNQIFKNPLFRICGVVIILYYGLLKDKSNPESLARRLSSERIKANISEISHKSYYVINNIQNAESIKKAEIEKYKQKQTSTDKQ